MTTTQPARAAARATVGATIGVFGGSGFYSFLEAATEVVVDTPYGAPSAPLAVGEVAGRSVAFLPRHGRRHELPPHRINFRANLWAMASLGVRRVVAPCAAGSLRAGIAPGDFVVLDQFVDRTRGRDDTFFDGPASPAGAVVAPGVHHVPLADPYCPELGALAVARARAAGVTVHDGGTMVVVPGPRFSTRAESAGYRAAGCSVIGMTQYPEVALARELGLCFCGVALVTDYDTGLEGPDGEKIAPVSAGGIFAVIKANLERVRTLIFDVIAGIPDEPGCACPDTRGPFAAPFPP